LSASASSRDAGYARGARVLSVGIASTGLFTFAYFSVASHVLSKADYGAVSTLWAVLFVVISVIYRPVEQLLSRTIAERIARGLTRGHPLRVPLTIQGGFAVVFLAIALALKGPVTTTFNGSATLYWVFVGATLAYAASYFARGYLAGHRWFELYGGLVLFESVSRFLFPLAVAVGLASGESAVALGIVAAPCASLLVVPWALRRHQAAAAGEGVEGGGMSLRTGADFAVAVAVVQLAEQALLNGGVLSVRASAGSALAGVVFSALLIARAPLQLFQAVQTSLLPHLTELTTNEGGASVRQAIRTTLLAIAGFAGLVAVGLIAIGPTAMDVLFGGKHAYGRFGLALLAVGMGFHLASGALNQVALARGRARVAAVAWLATAVAFLLWLVLPIVGDQLLRVEIGYPLSTAVLAALLWRYS
jgi:O-antigen/teichoic acid export membrane protein